MWLKDPKKLSPFAQPMKYETSSPVDALLVVTKPDKIKLSINKNHFVFQ